MDRARLTEALVGGVVAGFAFGIGSYLAVRFLTKINGNKPEKEAAPSPEEVPPSSSFNGHSNYIGHKRRRYSSLNEIDFSTASRGW